MPNLNGFKQHAERYYFERFRRASNLDADPVFGDKPDVIIHLDRKVGVEITNFYFQPGSDSASEQRQRVWRENVISEAQSRYQQEGGRNFELTVQFNSKTPIRRHRIAPLIGELLGLARRLEGYRTGPVDFELFASSPELQTVWLNAREYLDAKWRITQVYTVDFLSPDTLRSILVEKEAKAASYQLCAAYWLLIVIDWADPAQDQEIPINYPVLESHVFERVILYKTCFDEIVDVKRLESA